MTRVLLADDHPMIGAALDMLFRGSDYELVGRARSGADAVAQAQRLNPDILLLDVNMPGGSGIEVLGRLREAGQAPRTILLTALRGGTGVHERRKNYLSGLFQQMHRAENVSQDHLGRTRLE